MGTREVGVYIGAFAISICFINSTGLKFLCFLKWKNASFLRKIQSALGLGFRTTCSTCVKKVSFRLMVIFILAVLHVPVVPFIRLNMLNSYWASILEKFWASKQANEQASKWANKTEQNETKLEEKLILSPTTFFMFFVYPDQSTRAVLWSYVPKIILTWFEKHDSSK